jgi:hypothetical protein
MRRWKAKTAHKSPCAYGTIATILPRLFLTSNAYSDLQ